MHAVWCIRWIYLYIYFIFYILYSIFYILYFIFYILYFIKEICLAIISFSRFQFPPDLSNTDTLNFVRVNANKFCVTFRNFLNDYRNVILRRNKTNHIKLNNTVRLRWLSRAILICLATVFLFFCRHKFVHLEYSILCHCFSRSGVEETCKQFKRISWSQSWSCGKEYLSYIYCILMHRWLL